MPNTVRFVVSFDIHDGKGDEFAAIAREMVAGTQHEDGALAYEFFVNADKTRARLFEEYRDPAAAFAHLNGAVVRDLVPKLIGTCAVRGFEVLGDAGPDVMGIVGNFGAVPFAHAYGVARA
jgi:quinol monooxygenase YgiN